MAVDLSRASDKDMGITPDFKNNKKLKKDWLKLTTTQKIYTKISVSELSYRCYSGVTTDVVKESTYPK